jgi:rubrerythrin
MGERGRQRGGPRVSRRKLIALAGGSVAAAGVLSACGNSAQGETSEYGDGDVGILNYALTLEHVEAAFYAEFVQSGFLEGAGKAAFQKFADEEKDHVAALTEAVERLDGEPAKEPKTGFQLKDLNSALEEAGKLENLGAAAYLGQLANIESRPVLQTVLSIHSVEGKHAAAVNSLLGKPITPDGAFAKPATAAAVAKSLKAYLR